LVLKCAGELAPSLVAYLIPHYFSLPLHKMELEPLLKENMFRSPPAAFGWKGEAVEDRGHLKLLPHSVHKFVCELNALDPASRDCQDALPIREVLDAALPARRFYLDVGANHFPTSIGWFKRNYPVDFTRIFAWEARPDVFRKIPASQAAAEYDLSLADATRWIDSITYFNEKIHSIPDKSDGDLAHILSTHVRKEDYCVVKIDVDGSEWKLVPHLEEVGAIGLIDELFIEIHFHHEMMARSGWDAFPHTINETAELMVGLRKIPNLIFHYWP
jgi:hypothetical protein